MPLDAGDLRTGQSRLVRATNAQQRRLVAAYDAWAAALWRELAPLVKRLFTTAQVQAVVQARLPMLEREMLAMTHEGVLTAQRLVIGRAKPTPRVLAARNMHLLKNDELVVKNLVPFIGARLTEAISQGGAAELKGLKTLLAAQRLAPAAYAGGFWAMLHETKRAVGQDEDDGRRAQGMPPAKVRWVLDPLAKHCQARPGYQGCPELAGEYPGGWDTMPTVPAGKVACLGNCVLPGNIVMANGIEVAFKSHYSGWAVEFVTQAGIKFAVTANHPILTPQGWLAAKLLREGDYVVGSSFGQLAMGGINQDYQNVPTLVEQIWDALSMQAPINAGGRVIRVPDDFHGDGRFLDGDVQVIFANGQLRREFGNAFCLEHFNHKLLGGALLATIPLSAKRPCFQIGGGTPTPPNSVVIGGNLGLPLLSGHSGPFNSLGLTLGTKLNASFFEGCPDSASAYAQILRQLQDAFSAEVTLDKIVQIRNFDYTGDVYDLQTDTGYLLLSDNIAHRQGIVNSNCRCEIEIFREGRWQ